MPQKGVSEFDSQEKWIEYCMSSDIMKKERPDNKARYAKCKGMWDSDWEPGDKKEENKIRKIIRNELSLILEKFVAGVESDWSGEYREIFVNPDKKEVLEMRKIDAHSWGKGGDVRFIALSEEKKVYVTTADIIHITIAETVGLKDLIPVPTNFWGIGKIKQGNIIITYFADQYCVEDELLASKAILGGKFDWMKKYNFDLSRFKKKIESNI